MANTTNLTTELTATGDSGYETYAVYKRLQDAEALLAAFEKVAKDSVFGSPFIKDGWEWMPLQQASGETPIMAAWPVSGDLKPSEPLITFWKRFKIVSCNTPAANPA